MLYSFIVKQSLVIKREGLRKLRYYIITNEWEISRERTKTPCPVCSPEPGALPSYRGEERGVTWVVGKKGNYLEESRGSSGQGGQWRPTNFSPSEKSYISCCLLALGSGPPLDSCLHNCWEPSTLRLRRSPSNLPCVDATILFSMADDT